MEQDNHIFLKNGSEIFGLRRPDTQIGSHHRVNVRFFAQTISLFLKRRTLRNGPTACSTLARRANQGRATSGAAAFSTARTIARLATIGTTGARQAGYRADAAYILKRVAAARAH